MHFAPFWVTFWPFFIFSFFFVIFCRKNSTKWRFWVHFTTFQTRLSSREFTYKMAQKKKEKKRDLDVNCRAKSTFQGVRSYHYTCLPDKNASQTRLRRKFAYRERTYILELTTEFERNATFWCFFQLFTIKVDKNDVFFYTCFYVFFHLGRVRVKFPEFRRFWPVRNNSPPPLARQAVNRWGWRCVCVCVWYLVSIYQLISSYPHLARNLGLQRRT